MCWPITLSLAVEAITKGTADAPSFGAVSLPPPSAFWGLDIMANQPSTLTDLLEQLHEAANQQQRVSIGLILDVVGRRSFGPVLLVMGLLILSPLGAIPAMPTTVALLVLLTALQLLFGRQRFYFPGFLTRRSAQASTLKKGLAWFERPAGWADRLLAPRLPALAGRSGSYVVALSCVFICLSIPALELLPFSALAAGLALTVFGLALFFQDGLLTLVGLLIYGVIMAALVLGF